MRIKFTNGGLCFRLEAGRVAGVLTSTSTPEAHAEMQRLVERLTDNA